MFKVVSQRLSISFFKKTLVVLGGVLGVYVFYIWRLGTLTAGLSPAEVTARHLSSNWHFISDNPVNSPQRLLQWLAQYLGHHGVFYMRLPSVIFMIIFVGCFYLLLKAWFGRLIGLLGTLILVGTPWLILTARSATSAILLLAPLGVIAAFMYFTKQNKRPKLALIVLTLVGATSLYVPGLVWFILLAGLIRRRELMAKLKDFGLAATLLCAALALVIISPLVLAIVNDTSVGRQLILIPGHWQSTVDSLKSIGWSASSLVWRTPYHSGLTIGRLPLLNIMQLALAIFGGFAMWTKARRETYQLLAILIASIIASGINANLELLIPAVLTVCIFAAAGLRYLYLEWRGVFPRNPIPKGLALSLMTLVVGLHLLLGLRYALTAWPHTPPTHNLYMIK